MRAEQEDSCGGTTHGSIWDQYARMRDALNNTGRPIYYSITGIVPYNDAWPSMHVSAAALVPQSCKSQIVRYVQCIGDGRPGFAGAFTVRPWVAEGRDPGQLANAYLIEYCNNEDKFGTTAVRPGGFLSQLDSQSLLTYDVTIINTALQP